MCSGTPLLPLSCVIRYRASSAAANPASDSAKPQTPGAHHSATPPARCRGRRRMSPSSNHSSPGAATAIAPTVAHATMINTSVPNPRGIRSAGRWRSQVQVKAARGKAANDQIRRARPEPVDGDRAHSSARRLRAAAHAAASAVAVPAGSDSLRAAHEPPQPTTADVPGMTTTGSARRFGTLGRTRTGRSVETRTQTFDRGASGARSSIPTGATAAQP